MELEPSLHLEPDVLVVPATTSPRVIGPDTRWTDFRDWWLAVEISGRGSRIYDRDHKVAAYLAVGVQEVWRVDLMDRCAYVSRPGSLEVRCPERIEWGPPDIAEPVVVDVPALFTT